MTLEQALILALSITSTISGGLAAALASQSNARFARRGLVLAANVFVLPVFAWLIVRAAGVEDGALGLVLCAAAPGGSTGPLMALLARGDPRIATQAFVLLAFAGVASALVVTSIVEADRLGDVARAAAIVLVTSVLPLAIGLLLGRHRSRLAAAIAPWTSRLSVGLLIATLVLLASRHGSSADAKTLLASTPLVVASLMIGAAGTSKGAVLAIAQISAVRNLTLVLVVLSAISAPPAAISAVLAYGLIMYVGSAFVAVAARVYARS